MHAARNIIGTEESALLMAGFLDDVVVYPLDKVAASQGKEGILAVNGTYRDEPFTLVSTGNDLAGMRTVLSYVIDQCPEKDIILARIATGVALRQSINIQDLVISGNQIYYDDTVTEEIAHKGFIAQPDPDVSGALFHTAWRLKADEQSVYRGNTKSVNAYQGDAGEYLRNAKELPLPIALSKGGSVYAALAQHYNGKRIRFGEMFSIGEALTPTVSDNAVSQIGLEAVIQLRTYI